MRTLLCLLLLSLPVLGEVLWRSPTSWGEIRVVQEGDVRRLLFWSSAGETTESEMSLADPSALSLLYTRQMMAAISLWEVRSPRPPESFLLVGLGGASLSKRIARQFPTATVTSVEIEPLVVQAARDWFQYEESSRVVTVVDDARHYLEVSADRHDVILLDAFDEGGPPDALRTVEFFQLVEQHLKPGGVVISNVHYDPWLPARRYLRSAAEVFASSYFVDTPGNGATVFSREPLSSLRVWEARDDYQRRYELPVNDLLNPRLTVDLEKIRPYRDKESNGDE